MKHYKAPWSRMLLIVTVLGSMALLFITVRQWSALSSLDLASASFWFALAPLTMIFGPAMYTVRGYSITADAILVHRLFWDTKLPRKELLSAASEPDAFKGAFRSFGNGGMFSFTGWYHGHRLGNFRAYATDGQRTVVLRFRNRTIVVTPEDPDDFVRELTGPV